MLLFEQYKTWLPTKLNMIMITRLFRVMLTSLAEVGHGWREHALDGNVLLFGPLDKWRIRRTL